ncbi:MAG: adenylate/guanylate cyclase domain-containing protein [Gammaproteobacteria bacterium]|nr:adenylate/guanylate cyclase domain-containing protein [Gammaproteobacteria bacterium]
MSNSLVNLITKSQRSVTILFTDIVDSTRYWGRKGDIKGRLMVDQHNRLVFPVVKKFRGKVVKTIGDAVMASFPDREDAIRAAIGIQQALAEYRRKDDSFTLKLRIGLHTGQAIVEKRDVFGDTVNVASRIEAHAEADEILISSSTASKLSRKDFRMTKKDSFVPKGKSRSILVYQIDWKNTPSVINDINFNSVLPIMARQRAELFLYLSAALGLVYFVFQKYLRYMLVEQERVDILTYSPQQMLTDHPYVISVFVTAALLLLVSLRYLYIIPLLWLRLVKGLFGYALIFFALFYSVGFIPAEFRYNSNEILYESSHLFVEIVSDDAKLYAQHHPYSDVVKSPKANEIYLQVDVVQTDEALWNMVLIKQDVYAWVERLRPASVGVAEARLSSSNKFYFRYMDMYVLLTSLLGLVWGFFSFSVKPV